MGSHGVGKSAIARRFLKNSFSESYQPTVEETYSTVLQTLTGSCIRLVLTDTAGLHHFPAMRELRMRTGDAFLLVFSFDSQESFQEALRLHKKLKQVRGGDISLRSASFCSDVSFASGNSKYGQFLSPGLISGGSSMRGSMEIPTQALDFVKELLKLCLRTYFMFNGTIYEQVKGTPMGSPISGFIAEAVLQRLESLVFQHHRPKFWARYLDDTFVVIERDQVLTFQEHLNAVFPDIQFTMEEEENNQLAFLDVLVCRKDSGELKTKVFRKATNTM
nr:unnamed protein product [Spirometra erinaceieuropaei]